MGARGGTGPLNLHFLDGEALLPRVRDRAGESRRPLLCNYLQANGIVKRLERCFHTELEIILLLIC